MSLLNREMRALAMQAGGSYKTVHDRIRLVDRFSEYLSRLNIQIKKAENLKAKHIESYIKSRLVQGIKVRTLHNEMAAVRSILRCAGRHRLAEDERISNRALNLSGASRAGTKLAITDEHYQAVLVLARQKDEGFAVTIELARLMGLRSQEAVQSVMSLKTWQKALEAGETRLTIVFGTKGGRPRDTVVLDSEKVKLAVDRAIRSAEQRDGKLINASDLKTAMTYWRNHTKSVGLEGQFSPHSLRYAWAQDALRCYEEQGFSHKEARALVSMDLGHGDGRGRYVERVYGNVFQ